MLRTKLNVSKKLEPAEKFFYEKSLELLSSKTLDTYRLRINNPKSILEEIISVIDNVKKGTLKESYIEPLCKEALQLIRKENELTFKSITKSYFLNSISNKNYNDIYYGCSIVINENRSYSHKLFKIIKNEITAINSSSFYTYDRFDNLNRFIQHFLVELKKYGYSKQYMYSFLMGVFGGNHQIPNFDYGMQVVETLIDRKPEKFNVYIAFQLTGNADELLKFNSFELKHISKAEIEVISKTINKRFERFIQEHKNQEFFQLEIEAVDYYTAGKTARLKVQKALDLLHLATDEDVFNFSSTCFVHGTVDPNRGKSQNLSYKLDGHFVPTVVAYKRFIRRFNKIPFKKIDPATIKRIFSTLRYLRYGTLASEQEHKLLNYWIAIEYLFSAANSQEKKTDRLNEYFKKIHANSYVRRLLLDLHESIRDLKLEKLITKFSHTDLRYLFESTTEHEIEQIKARYPLLYYRFHTIKNRYKDSESILNDLRRHSNNVEWNLIRIYRTRNEIVHSAAMDIEVLELAGHVKYFLIFTINALIAFLLTSPFDMNGDKLVSIDDFFLMESVRYDSILKNQNLTIGQMMGIINPIEYLQK